MEAEGSHKVVTPHSPKAAAASRSLQLLQQGRRRSIVELGGGGGGGLNMKEAMEAAMKQSPIHEGEGEDDEEKIGDKQQREDDSKVDRYEVDEALLQYHVDIGTVLDVACDGHLLLNAQQKLCVWSTVAFVNADRHCRGNLTFDQFSMAMEGCEPARNEKQLAELFNDLVYASENSQMSYKTFKDSAWKLFVDDMLKCPEVSEDDMNGTAMKFETGKYVDVKF